jgi:hypothetical protein
MVSANRLGILVGNLGHSQQTFELGKSVNQFVDSNKDVDLCIFCQNILPTIYPINTSIMNLYDIWGYNGVTLASNLEGAKILSKIHGKQRKIFYVYNFEWTHNPHLYYDYMMVAKDLEIITRTPAHDSMFNNCFNRKSLFTLQEFDLGELWNKLNTKST